ncbi:AGE family epimerase/isomerase [Microbacter margulisiae]|uniref:Cellobiose 2-epimerase n=1 Tax=Microbacter margulisiae TaxID=1350067 RepID=A0A7W5H3D4_9PORP|nr:AGE family epimerase/isomerase [Microbacter margulisiae]MBB3188720.1 mannobiose 2-epimerase [Microbacter margulisiae]
MTNEAFKTDLTKELKDNIIPYWMTKAKDLHHGGFIGQIDGNETPYPDAPKGAILHARILWTFSAAYSLLQDPKYLEIANETQAYFLNHFMDHSFDGVYWLIDSNGHPLDTKKQMYAQGFAMYGLSEHARVTRNQQSLDEAIKLYHLIEEKSFDRQRNGYFEAFTQDWKDIPDMRLSLKDANEKKTMNTHLHILEAYTNLFRVWTSDVLKTSLDNLINLFLDYFIDPETGHLNLFFDEKWNKKEGVISYGHEIETSWLLHEAAIVLGDKALQTKVEKALPKIIKAAREGIQPDGSLLYELNTQTGEIDSERHWWVQAENVVGLWKAYKLFGMEQYKEEALACWNYIQQHTIDHEHGEWVWSTFADGSVNRAGDKAGFWKCPYHNSRMCIEIIQDM